MEQEMKTNVKKERRTRVPSSFRYAEKEKKIHVSWQKDVKMVGEAFGGVKNGTCWQIGGN